MSNNENDKVEFHERTKSYADFIKKGGLLVDAEELQKVKKELSVFVVDKLSHKICLSTKNDSRMERPFISVFEVPPQVLGENLAAYLVQFGQILSSSGSH